MQLRLLFILLLCSSGLNAQYFTAQVKPITDYGNCYTGFVGPRGDTVWPMQFEKVSTAEIYLNHYDVMGREYYGWIVQYEGYYGVISLYGVKSVPFEFTSIQMITNVKGSFGAFRANAKTNGDDFNDAAFEFEAEIDSINTGVADRDAHLKSDDFFNAEAYPLLGFRSTNVRVNGDELLVEGTMTIRDITKPVTLKGEFAGIVTDPYGQTKAGLTLSGKIKRSEFGLKWNAITEAGGVVVSDDIQINNEIQLVKAS